MTIKIEILYSNESIVVIDAFDIPGLESAIKTGILAIVLWEPVNGKRIPIEYLDENDNYTIYIQKSAGVVAAYSFDNNKSGWWHYGNPHGTDGYDKPVMPPMFFFVESPGVRKFHFFGEQIDNAIWVTTKSKRLDMQKRTRNV